MRPPASPIAFRGACLRPHAHGWVGVGWREGCGEVKRESKSPKRATAYRMFPATPRHRPPARARTLGGEQGSRASGHASPSACAQTSGRQPTRLWYRRPRPIGLLHQRQKPNSTKKTNASRKPPHLPQSNKSNENQNATINTKCALLRKDAKPRQRRAKTNAIKSQLIRRTAEGIESQNGKDPIWAAHSRRTGKSRGHCVPEM